MEALKTVIAIRGYTQTKVAEMVGTTKQNLFNKIARTSMRVDEWIELLDLLDVDVILIDRETGEKITKKKDRIKGHGKRVCGTVNHVRVDTEKADAISNTFYLDGENEYKDGQAEELYRNKNGIYFLVTYYEDGRTKISAIDDNLVVAFTEKYGIIQPEETE